MSDPIEKGDPPRHVTGKTVSLYKPLPDDKLMCTACARYCRLKDGQVGFCGIRGAHAGKLWLYAYGRIIAGHVDPIEKKPVIHYRPGSKIFSIATTGCNWMCHYCQNFDISQRRKLEGTEVTPSEVVAKAIEHGCQGISYTYNEPSIFMEFAHDIGVLARKSGLINTFVSNGYATPEAVAMMPDFLDCITVDFKGSGERNFVRKFIHVPDVEPVFQTLLEMKNKTKVHIEITDLIVPGVGDNLDAARHLSKWVYDNLGPDISIHFLRFHPDYRMMEFPSTPIATLEKHCEVAKQAGLRYVYIGNVPGHSLEHTYCHGCGTIVVKRHGFDITGWYLDRSNRCKECGTSIPIVGSLEKTARDDRFYSVLHGR